MIRRVTFLPPILYRDGETGKRSSVKVTRNELLYLAKLPPTEAFVFFRANEAKTHLFQLTNAKSESKINLCS